MTAGINHRSAPNSVFGPLGAAAWSDGHDLVEAGGQTLTIGLIPDGTFVKRSGNVLVGASPASILYADAPNSAFDLTNGGAGGAVQILQLAIPSIPYRSQLIVELEYRILQSTGTNRTYTQNMSLGGFTAVAANEAAQASSAATQKLFNHRLRICPSANNLVSSALYNVGNNPQNNGVYAALVAGASFNGWASAATDVGGAQNFTWTVASDSTLATQTLTLMSYAVSLIAQA